MDAERSHDLTLKTMAFLDEHPYLARLAAKALNPDAHALSCKSFQMMGITFPNRVGLAAGLDKNAVAPYFLSQLGFGFVEIGTLTPKPQQGNPKPRMFRLTDENAIINRMGFNNIGIDAAVVGLKAKRDKADRLNLAFPILGINLGKNKDTPNEDAYLDYLYGLEKLYPYADYMVINISSPNTQNLRLLSHSQYLVSLLSRLKEAQLRLQAQHQKSVPLVLKISPDLSFDEIHQMATDMISCQIDGIIATNTTIDRAMVVNHPLAHEIGGLSGQPLFEPSNAVLQTLCTALQGKIPVIAAGGIFSKEDAIRKIKLGAKMVQLYSGFIYRGPELITEVIRALSK